MCGRCLSEGRSLHTEKTATSTDEDGAYELQIYPGYCTLNPAYAAQQLIVKKKRKANSGGPLKEDAQTAPLQQHPAQASIDPPQAPPLNTENRDLSNEVANEETKSNNQVEVQNQLSVNRSDTTASTSPTGSSTETLTITKSRFLFDNLHVFVLDERLRSHQNKVVQWVHKVIGEETVVSVASLDASQSTVWNTSTITRSIKQFACEVCTETTVIEACNEVEDQRNEEESALVVSFVSVSSELKPTYTAEFFRLFQRHATSKGSTLQLKSAYMVDPPTTSLACCLLLRAIYRRLRQWSRTDRRAGPPTPSTTGTVALHQTAPSIALIIYHRDTDYYLRSLNWPIRVMNAGLHWLLQSVGLGGLASSLYCEETLAYLSDLCKRP